MTHDTLAALLSLPLDLPAARRYARTQLLTELTSGAVSLALLTATL
jgi:hypothetical protein